MRTIEEITNRVFNEDCNEFLKSLPDECIDLCVTSPPYFGLRNYHADGEIGQENSADQYVSALTEVFMNVHRVLKSTGTLYINIGDSYSKDKQMNCTPWKLAIALQQKGWILRQDIVWEKNPCLPESVKDRFTKCHEYIFMLTKSKDYYFNTEAAQEPATSKQKEFKPRQNTSNAKNSKYLKDYGQSPHSFLKRVAEGKPMYEKTYETRNKRSVWHVSPIQEDKNEHCAAYPMKLIEPCIRISCPKNGIVLDPFMGGGTTAKTALRLDRNFTGSELNKDYCSMIEKRIKTIQTELFTD